MAFTVIYKGVKYPSCSYFCRVNKLIYGKVYKKLIDYYDTNDDNTELDDVLGDNLQPWRETPRKKKWGVIYDGVFYRTFTELVLFLNLSPQNLLNYFRRHGISYQNGVDVTEGIREYKRHFKIA